MSLSPLFLLQLLFGLVVLFAGRRLYWFFVGVVGFMVGASLAAQFVSADPWWLVLLIALGVGLISSLLSVFLQRLALGIAGFVAGAYLVQLLLGLLNWEAGQINWILALLGGVIGAVLVAVLFDWALILLSALVGAGLVGQFFGFNPPLETLVFLGLLLVGVAVQGGTLGRERARAGARPAAQMD
jgi:hypothetical protein